MAAPTPSVNQYQQGHLGKNTLHAKWDTLHTDNFGSKVLVDLSALEDGYTSELRARHVFISGTTGLGVRMFFDGQDQPIAIYPEGASGLHHYPYQRTTWITGFEKQTVGGTGDIIFDTTGATEGDELFIYIEWWAG